MDGKLKREVLAVHTRAMTTQEIESERMNEEIVRSEQTIAIQIVLDETEEIR